MLHVAPEDPNGPIVGELITQLSRELAERCGNCGSDGARTSAPRDFTAPRSTFLVAWFGGDAAGGGAIRPFDDRTAEVNGMFVSAAWRGRGIGREILRQLEARARAFGYTRLCLEAGDRQPEAIALFAKAGFRAIPRVDAFANNRRGVCLGKELWENPVVRPVEPAA